MITEDTTYLRRVMWAYGIGSPFGHKHWRTKKWTPPHRADLGSGAARIICSIPPSHDELDDGDLRYFENLRRAAAMIEPCDGSLGMWSER